MKTIARISLAALLLAGQPAHAQEDREAQPRYAVEVVIFQYLDQTQTTEETPLPPDPLATSVAPGIGPDVEFLLLDPVNGGPGFERLAQEDRSLGNAWQRLERLDAYRPLAYLSWSQLTRPRAAAQGLRLAEAGSIPPGLSGQVTLYKERYLHLALDLAWQASSNSLDGPGQATRPAATRIEESRRLRGDVVQYFDNPRFGAITYVRELEVAEAAEAAAAAVEPPG